MMSKSIPYLDYIHVVLSESACLISTDYMCWTHCLAAGQSLYEVFLFQHLLYWECQAEGDSQRQALGYSYDDKGYT